MPIPFDKKSGLDEIIYSEPVEKISIKPKSRLKGFFKVILVLCLLSVSGWVAYGKVSQKLNPASQSGQTAGKSWSWFSGFSLLNGAQQIAEGSTQKLKGEASGRINVLLLGIGGKNHDGGLLTDTIMIASIEPATKKVAMISIPRDLSVPIEGYGWRKINSINAFAEKENPGSGGQATSQAIGNLFNINIDYYLTVDFSAFTNIVDELGGLNVNVENTLDDYSYPVLGMEDSPNWNARWEHLHVEAGPQKMDGKLALKFARSRHGINGEGSDFARAKRQQLIMEAVKNQVLTLNVLLKPKMITTIFETYKDHLSTNISVWEMVKFWGMLKDVKKEQIINKVLDNSPAGLLMDQTGVDGAYLLVPRSGDFSQVIYLIKNIFNDAPAETKKIVSKEQTKIEIRNGTWVNGLANRASTDLEQLGFEVIGIANASQRNFQKSVIYDLTSGSKPESLALLKENTKANVAYGLPEWLRSDLAKASTTRKTNANPDFILILGQGESNQ